MSQRHPSIGRTSPHSLLIFTEVPGIYHSDFHWLDGNTPQHPLFERGNEIKKIIRDIKSRLADNILHGVRNILKDSQNPNKTALFKSLEENPELWVAIISVQKYGVVYLASRGECRHFLSIIRERPTEADVIDAYLRTDSVAVRAINYAVHRFVTEPTLSLKVETPTTLVPLNAISALGPNHIAVREKDFSSVCSSSVLNDPNPLYDLHDFSHLTTATLSSALYGNKYFQSLHILKPNFRSLITSRGLKNLKGPLISDGIIFSQFLTELFTNEAELAGHTYTTLTTALAQELADYLMARKSLIHSATGREIQLETPITPTQLAILAQNKRYELSASEMEQRVFFRGGPPGDARDALDSMTARMRIEYLAESSSWTYFEVRNTVKHRAMREAYGIIAKEFTGAVEAMGLCEADLEIAGWVLGWVEYRDWKNGQVVDLWGLLVEREGKE